MDSPGQVIYSCRQLSGGTTQVETCWIKVRLYRPVLMPRFTLQEVRGATLMRLYQCCPPTCSASRRLLSSATNLLLAMVYLHAPFAKEWARWFAHSYFLQLRHR